MEVAALMGVSFWSSTKLGRRHGFQLRIASTRSPPPRGAAVEKSEGFRLFPAGEGELGG
jgi:hypothetical protein